MKIERSEIWYSYSTIYDGPLIPFNVFAGLLLATKITRCVYNSEGMFYYIKNKKIESQIVESNVSVDMSKISYSLNNWPDDGFSKETLYQNLLNNYFENKHFSINTKFIDHSYIRFSLDEIVIEDDKNRFHIYPFLNFYNSGIIILEMRIIYDFSINIKDFIDRYINLSIKEFKKCYSNKSLSEYSKTLTNSNFDINSITDEGIDFKFELFEFFIPNSKHKTISNIALQIFEIIEYIISKPFKEKRKYRKYNFNIGKYWMGKPHIHILKFSKQSKYASDNYKLHELDIKRIMNRFFFNKKNFKCNTDLIDNRLFEDFNTFFNLAVSLNIWSLSGLNNNKQYQDPNFNTYIYSNQVINRFLDFYYMLFKKALYSIEKTKNYSDILSFQTDFYYMISDYNQFANSGELNKLFENAKNEFEIEKHENVVKNLLEIKRLELENQKNTSFNILSILISIVLGIISAGDLRNDFIKPIWNFFKLPLFYSNDLNDIMLWIISLIIIIFSLKFIFNIFKGHKK